MNRFYEFINQLKIFQNADSKRPMYHDAIFVQHLIKIHVTIAHLANHVTAMKLGIVDWCPPLLKSII